MTEAELGTVYLLHFDRAYAHAGHYLGWTRGPESVSRTLPGYDMPRRWARISA